MLNHHIIPFFTIDPNINPACIFLFSILPCNLDLFFIVQKSQTLELIQIIRNFLTDLVNFSRDLRVLYCVIGHWVVTRSAVPELKFVNGGPLVNQLGVPHAMVVSHAFE